MKGRECEVFETKRESRAGHRGQGRGRGQRTGPGCPGFPVRYCKHPPFPLPMENRGSTSGLQQLLLCGNGPNGKSLADRQGWPAHTLATLPRHYDEGPVSRGTTTRRARCLKGWQAPSRPLTRLLRVPAPGGSAAGRVCPPSTQLPSAPCSPRGGRRGSYGREQLRPPCGPAESSMREPPSCSSR